jgi:halocyanin-like protein
MDEDSPLEDPGGSWWDRTVNRRETIWLGLSGAWALSLFGWMIGWTQAADQNQVGPTYSVSADAFQSKVTEFKRNAGTLTREGTDFHVPAGEDVYVGALQWAWDGLPAVLKPGETYRFHLGSYDVQHGFSVRREDNLSQQISLQILPGYEWVLEMSFDDPGTYHVVCNEFCGNGHRSMHGRFLVADYDESEVTPPDAQDPDEAPYDGWFTGQARGGATGNFDGTTVDRTDVDSVTVTVGAEGNGATYAFDPPAVRVSAGTTVTFEWTSDTHNVLLDSQPDGSDWAGHESIENTGFTTSHTFETRGLYRYYCNPHLSAGMKGVLEVV